VLASLNDWRFQGYLFQDGTGFLGGAMKAFYYSRRGIGVVFVVHSSRPLCRAYLFSAFSRRCAMRRGFGGEGGDVAIIRGGMWWCLCDYRYQYTIR
jgi:hypothetical protein